MVLHTVSRRLDRYRDKLGCCSGDDLDNTDYSEYKEAAGN